RRSSVRRSKGLSRPTDKGHREGARPARARSAARRCRPPRERAWLRGWRPAVGAWHWIRFVVSRMGGVPRLRDPPKPMLLTGAGAARTVCALFTLPLCRKPIMPKPLIALDWGTTRARAFLISETGEVLQRRVADQGIQSVPAGGYPAAFEALAGDFR